MIFTFIKYLILVVAHIPLIVLFVLFVPTTRRKYWAGWASLGADRYGMDNCAYLRKRKTLRWRAGILSLNLGYSADWDDEQRARSGPVWEKSRARWLKKHGFKRECPWVPTGEAIHD